MKQEFFKTTLISKFIKQLLAKTPLPVYKLIYDNDEMVAGCLYTYKDKVLRCTKSGRFTGVRGTVNKLDYLTVQEPLLVNEGNMNVYTFNENKNEFQFEEVPFAVTDDVVSIQLYTPAEFEVVSRFVPDTYVPGITQSYVSNMSYYDEDTHRKLGEYLRYIKNMYDLNLMPLYNCFTYKLVDNLTLDVNSENNLTQTSNTKYKTFLIPIKFDKTYTIALDSDFPVMMKAVFYNNRLVKDRDNQFYLSNYLDESIIVHNNTQFSRPFTYVLPNTKAVDSSGRPCYQMLHNYEKYLYLAIQISADNDSSLVVLEGDYSRNGTSSITDVYGLRRDVNTTDAISAMLTSRLSLLDRNDGIHHPFADKLIQYLLRNTIDTREDIDDNVANVEKAVGYMPEYQGMWDDNLRYLLFFNYMKLTNREELNFLDILGYVDSDIEEAVRKGYIDANTSSI